VAPLQEATPGLRTAVQQTNFRDTLVVAREAVPPKVTAESYLKAQMKRSANKPMKTEEHTHHGETGLLSETRAKGPHGEQLLQIQLTIARPGEVWIAIGTTLAGGPGSRRTQILQMLDSLVFP
jgi:hypothetical protein